MKVFCTLSDFSNDDTARCGNAWGFANHTAETIAAIKLAGCTIVSNASDADVVLHTGPPHMCHAYRGKVNVAHTCWESSDIPPNFSGPLAEFDGVSVASSFLVEPFRNALLGLGADVPVVYIPDGVDCQRFGYVDRHGNGYKHKVRPPKVPLRFLWLGAPNRRKGGEQAISIWKAFSEHPKFAAKYGSRVELYIKTSVPAGESRGVVHSKAERIIYDDRRVSDDDLVKIYQRAHCFIFPSIGEGFALTMAEAMATGLPVIYTPATAMTDLAPSTHYYPPELPETEKEQRRYGYPVSSDYGYPIRFDWKRDPWEWDEEGQEKISMMVVAASPDINDLFRKVIWVADHYADAVKRGRRGAERMRRFFRWESTGKRLMAFLQQVIDDRAEGAGNHERR